MAHASELYPFAIGDGANVESAALWEGDNARQIGFVAGIASSQKVNTALRQAAFTSAMIAQFTAGYGPSDVVDDGDVAVYENNFVAALGAALQSLIPAGLLYEGVDTGTQNAAHVTATVPATTTFAAGSFIAVRKMASANSGPMTMQVLTSSGNLVWPDSSVLAPGVWPGTAEVLLYYDGSKFQLMTFPGPGMIVQVGSGEGINVTANQVNLAFNSLTEEDTLAGSDLFAFYQTIDEGGQTAGHHRKTTWANILAKVLAQIPTPGTPTFPANGPGNQVGQWITQLVMGGGIYGNYPPSYAGMSVGMTTSAANLMNGTVPTSGQQLLYQVRIHAPDVPAVCGYGAMGSGDWAWPFSLAGTWALAGWVLDTGFTFTWGYAFDLYWVRIA